jgi:hypothetical protein
VGTYLGQVVHLYARVKISERVGSLSRSATEGTEFVGWIKRQLLLRKGIPPYYAMLDFKTGQLHGFNAAPKQ